MYVIYIITYISYTYTHLIFLCCSVFVRVICGVVCRLIHSFLLLYSISLYELNHSLTIPQRMNISVISNLGVILNIMTTVFLVNNNNVLLRVKFLDDEEYIAP